MLLHTEPLIVALFFWVCLLKICWYVHKTCMKHGSADKSVLESLSFDVRVNWTPPVKIVYIGTEHVKCHSEQ